MNKKNVKGVYLKIPRSLLDKIDKIVRESGEYESRTEFIIKAVRDKLKEYEKKVVIEVAN